jgi:uncharacterized protein with ParB-like and HNH nuclease domain
MPDTSSKFEKTSITSLADLFSAKEKIIVPSFQRNYSWKSDTGDHRPVAKLYHDLLEKYNDFKYSKQMVSAEYLLGPMVFIPDNNLSSPSQTPSKIVEIVDGQQRLSTLTMMLCIIRDILIESKIDTITTKKSTWPDELSNFIPFTEIRASTAEPGISKHISWKLEMNRADSDTFKEYVQKYESESDDVFSKNPATSTTQYPYRKISTKINWLRNELSTSEFTDWKTSEKLIIRAYIFLYDTIQKGLIVNFENSLISDKKLQKFESECSEKAVALIKKNPTSYGLDEDHFTNTVDGLNVLQNQDWIHAEKEKFSAKFTSFSNTKLGKKLNLNLEKFRERKIKSRETKFKAPLKMEQNKIFEDSANKEKAQHIPWLLHFFNEICLPNIYVVKLNIVNELDAFQVFDTLNAGGTELSKSNMIKNLIIKNMGSDKELQNKCAEKWDTQVIEMVSEDNADTFVLESLRSRGRLKDGSQTEWEFDSFNVIEHTKSIVPSSKNLYAIIQKIITDPHAGAPTLEDRRKKEAETFVTNLTKDAKNYAFLSNHTIAKKDPSQPNRNLGPIIEDLNFLNAKYIKLPLYTAKRVWYDSKKSPDAFILLVKFLVLFFFKYKTISDNNATSLEKDLIKVCSIIQNGNEPMDDLHTSIKYLLSLYDDSQFELDFKKEMNDPSTEDNTKKYVLHRINSYLQDTPDVEPIDGLTLEHVLPQSPLINSRKPELNWINDDFFKYYSKDKIDYIKPPRVLPAEFSEYWCNLLGNLTLMSKSINGAVKNTSFSNKVSYLTATTSGYFLSNLGINTKTILHHENIDPHMPGWLIRKKWDVNTILERTNYLHELALDVFKLPKIFCENVQCQGNISSIDLTGDLEKITNTKCQIRMRVDGTVSPNICNGNLIVRWPKSHPPEYRVPDEYRKDF